MRNRRPTFTEPLLMPGVLAVLVLVVVGTPLLALWLNSMGYEPPRRTYYSPPQVDYCPSGMYLSSTGRIEFGFPLPGGSPIMAQCL